MVVVDTTQSGIKRHIRGFATSATLEINERSNALRAEGRTVYKLGLGQSPFPVPPPVVEALRQHATQKDYLPVRGLPDLREAVAGYHRRFNGIDCADRDVLIAPGSKELLYILQLIFDGDILLPSPSWVSYAPQANLFGNRVKWLDTRLEHHWKLEPDALELACRSNGESAKLLILNYPSNPTGFSFTEAELAALADVARRHNVLVLSDEIYAELHHTGHHATMASFYPERTIVSAGLSKWCGAGGWRLGTFVFPSGMTHLLDTMAVVASETFTATSAPIQYAAVTAFRQGGVIDDYIRESRRLLRALGSWIVNRLQDAGVTIDPPDGAFYLFPSFASVADALQSRQIRTSKDLCTRLLDDTGVATLPGSAFGRPPEELTMRLAYVDFDGENALKAASEHPGQISAGFLETHCPQVVTAVNRVVSWLRSD